MFSREETSRGFAFDEGVIVTSTDFNHAESHLKDERDASVDALVKIRNAGVRIGATDVLKVNAFDLFAGEVVAIIGRSGVGKTTLLRLISGDLPTFSGELSIGNFPDQRQIPSGYVSRSLQSFPLLHWLTVRENLELAAKLKGIDDANLFSILDSVSALHLADRYPGNLSGGERCRSSLSLSLVGTPRVLLLDEPFTGLDIAVKQSIAEKLFEWSRANNVATALVTHDLYDAIEFADRVVVLSGDRPSQIQFECRARAADAIERLRSEILKD